MGAKASCQLRHHRRRRRCALPARQARAGDSDSDSGRTRRGSQLKQRRRQRCERHLMARPARVAWPARGSHTILSAADLKKSPYLYTTFVFLTRWLEDVLVISPTHTAYTASCDAWYTAVNNGRRVMQLLSWPGPPCQRGRPGRPHPGSLTGNGKYKAHRLVIQKGVDKCTAVCRTRPAWSRGQLRTGRSLSFPPLSDLALFCDRNQVRRRQGEISVSHG